jgi:cytochrome c biogenesis protein CcmG, thiol:disulfide interchange protein DsbE
MRAHPRLVMATALALTAACRPTATPPPSSQHPLLGRPMPPIERAALDGATIDSRRFQGRVVVLEFFAKFCEPCRRTLPELRDLSRRAPEIAILGIAEDERQSDAEEMVAQYGLSFPVVLDRGHVISGRYRVNELPATFVADTSGTLRWFGGPGQPHRAAPDAAKALLEDTR